jgi:hypothetical protein
MKKILFALFTIFYLPGVSQTININDYTQTIYSTSVTKKSGANAFYAEIPPWVVKGGWYQYFFTTNFTATWSSTWSMANRVNEIKEVGQSSDYGPLWVLAGSNWWSNFYDPNFLASPSYICNQQWQTYHWRRNYNGIFSANVITQPNSGGQILFAVSHGENKNEKQGNYFYQNTVRPSFLLNNHPLRRWAEKHRA